MMRASTLAYGIIAYILFLFNGCAVEDLEDVVVVADVKDEFFLDFWEKLNPEGRSLEFLISTIEKEDCKNAFIDHQYRKSGSNITISLKDIRRPAVCEAGRAPARTTVDIGNLKVGFYSFTIDLKNTVFNEGELTMLNDRFLFNLQTENGVKLVRKELFRVPDETIWGYAHYTSPDDASSALQFVKKMKQIGAASPHKPGYYGHFTVGADGNIVAVHNQPQNGEVIPFLVGFRGDKSELQNLINDFRTNYGAEITFRLFNSLGESF